MKNCKAKYWIRKFIIKICFIFLLYLPVESNGQGNDKVIPRYDVTLSEAHIGNLKIDSELLDSYELLPENIRQFYFDARAVFSKAENASFDHPEILKSAAKHDIKLMGGPLLGRLKKDGVTIWLRPATAGPLTMAVNNTKGILEKSITIDIVHPGIVQRISVDGLTPETNYVYSIISNTQEIAVGSFTTAPDKENNGVFRLTFGSCFHKIGLHNSNLIHQILNRSPQMMVLLGDIAVDDRENNISMHRSDYLLRDVSVAWKRLSANVPLYTAWDDHDYLNNDLSGVPAKFTNADREALRKVWFQNWNNPENERDGIYFSTEIGPVELIMLDTRSCRNVSERGAFGSYLGVEQLSWLKKTLRNSTAPFKVITSGTMWSDYISNGKDSWGTWDTIARKEIFHFIEDEKISGVLLISGDRHGARGFILPVKSGFSLYEFEVASLGGVPGPDAMAEDPKYQLFGYHGSDIKAFGEFTFVTTKESTYVVFRLIDETGEILEEYKLPYRQLTPF